jgi:uncharacterized protein YecE (DUF72 family)
VAGSEVAACSLHLSLEVLLKDYARIGKNGALQGNGITALRQVRVGIAGWSNPPAMRAARRAAQTHLAHYAAHFSCVEVNSSFYRPHRGATYARWRDETPPQFRFSVKMPRSITHERHLRGSAAEVSRFYGEISHLQPKLAAVLVQLPPNLEYSAAAVRSFFRSVPRMRGTVVTCEPRHVSWFSKRAGEALGRLDVSRVGADPARSAGADVPGGAHRFAYFRWHGAPRMYYSKYSDAQLAALAVKVTLSKAKEVWCIFDNTAYYAAWDDALRFIPMIAPTNML